MKKKHVHHVHHRKVTAARSTKGENYLVVVRSWMLVVAFALMLGIGALVGTFLQQQFLQNTPEVAGAAIEAK